MEFKRGLRISQPSNDIIKWTGDNKHELMRFMNVNHLGLVVMDNKTCVMVDGEDERPIIAKPTDYIVRRGEYYEIITEDEINWELS